MTLSHAQFSALITIRDHGPVLGTEVLMPPKINGTRSVKLECNVLNASTLAKLERMQYVSVSRGEPYRPTDATGRKGRQRRDIQITITLLGRGNLDAADVL